MLAVRHTVGAVSAVFRPVFAEIPQNIAPQAFSGPGVKGHSFEPFLILGSDSFLLLRCQVRILFPVIKEPSRHHHILPAVKQNAVRVAAVPACPPGFLIVGFQAHGHVVVNDKGNVGFVDAHAKGVRRYHHPPAVKQKVFLVPGPFLLFQPGMIPGRGKALPLQHLTDALHVFPGGAVYDAGLPVPVPQQVPQRLIFIFRFINGKGKVRPVEAGGNAHRRQQAQIAQDILPHPGCRRGGESSDHRTLSQPRDEFRDAQIGWPEILSPLGNAVRFIHRHEGDLHLPDQLRKIRRLQPLRRHIQDFVPAGAGQLPDFRRFAPGHAAVQAGRRNAPALQGDYLILHQRNQRGNDDGRSRKRQRRNLIAQGFSGSRGHDAEGVLLSQQAFDNLLLPCPELRVSVNLLQNLPGGIGCRKGRASVRVSLRPVR